MLNLDAETNLSLVFQEEMSSTKLIEHITSDDHIGVILGNGGKEYYLESIEEGKNYSVKKYEYHRNFQPVRTIYIITE